MPERGWLDRQFKQIKRDIEKAFEGRKCCGGVRHELEVKEAWERVTAWLAQVEEEASNG